VLGGLGVYLIHTAFRLMSEGARTRPPTATPPTGLKAFLRTIGFTPSKTDRFVLKCCCLIVSATGLIALFVYAPAYWNPQAKHDSAPLDAILSTQHIDRIELISSDKTNSLNGTEAERFAASLRRTNRINHVDWTKQQVESVRLLSGMNRTWLFRGEDGSWEFGKYGFRTLSP
jgi:hypothetical protein